MENKLVTYKQLIIGQEIKGTKDSGRSSSFKAFVKDVNSSFVTVEMWQKGGTVEQINSSVMFEIEMTEEEFKEKHKEKAKEVLKNIANQLRKDEIGYHEMWNSWLYGTPYEIAQVITKQKIRIVGYCSDIIPKIAMFSGDTLDIGVCAEYEDGERFWCHYRYSDIIKMLERYQDLLKE